MINAKELEEVGGRIAVNSRNHGFLFQLIFGNSFESLG